MRASLWGVIGGFLLAVGFAFGYMHGRQSAEAARPPEEKAKAAAESRAARAAQGRLDKAALKEIERKLAERLEPADGAAAAPAKFDGSAKSLVAALKRAGLPPETVMELAYLWLNCVRHPFQQPKNVNESRDGYRIQLERKRKIEAEVYETFGQEDGERLLAWRGQSSVKPLGTIAGFSEEENRIVQETLDHLVIGMYRAGKELEDRAGDPGADIEHSRRCVEIKRKTQEGLEEKLGFDRYGEYLLMTTDRTDAVEAANLAGVDRTQLKEWLRAMEKLELEFYSPGTVEEIRRYQDEFGPRKRQIERSLFGAHYPDWVKNNSSWYQAMKWAWKAGRAPSDPDQAFPLVWGWIERIGSASDHAEKESLREEARNKLAYLFTGCPGFLEQALQTE